jgi:hypothetical protein
MANSTAPAPALKLLARRVLKSGALGVVGFIVARPRLDAFQRRQIYRFPGLAGRARAAIARSRRASGQALPVIHTEEADLTDSARQVLQALERAIDNSRPT